MDTYKGFSAARLRDTFAAMAKPEFWKTPRTVHEIAEAVAAIEYCGMGKR